MAKQRKPRQEPPQESVNVVTIDVPYLQDTDTGSYIARSLSATRLTDRQAQAFHAVFCRLREDGEFCDMDGNRDPRGKRVEDRPHVIRYLLDRVADGLGL